MFRTQVYHFESRVRLVQVAEIGEGGGGGGERREKCKVIVLSSGTFFHPPHHSYYKMATLSSKYASSAGYSELTHTEK